MMLPRGSVAIKHNRIHSNYIGDLDKKSIGSEITPIKDRSRLVHLPDHIKHIKFKGEVPENYYGSSSKHYMSSIPVSTTFADKNDTRDSLYRQGSSKNLYSASSLAFEFFNKPEESRFNVKSGTIIYEGELDRNTRMKQRLITHMPDNS